MTLIHAWVLYPLIVLALGAGWGALIEKATGTKLHGALYVPIGILGVIVVSGFFTDWKGSAPAATWICLAGAVAGLAWGRPWERLDGNAKWPALAALGVLLVYGAPVLLTGEPTFLGYLRLDDTGTWFDVTDNIMAHGHNMTGVATLPGGLQSTFALVFTGDVGPLYPVGAFQLLGVTHTLAGIDLAWVFDPCLACCAAAIALAVFALAEPFVDSRRLRALIAFLAAQPALLYGYYLWGGIKEITAAMALAVGVAVIAPMLRNRPGADGNELSWSGVLTSARSMVPLGVVAGGMLTILDAGAAAWIAPAFLILLGAWLYQAFTTGSGLWSSVRGLGGGGTKQPEVATAPADVPQSRSRGKKSSAAKRNAAARQAQEAKRPVRAQDTMGFWRGLLAFLRRIWGPTISTTSLIAVASACAVPMWLVVKQFLATDAGLFNAGQTSATQLGNLIQPLSGWQLFGIWTIGDFRLTAPTFPTAFLVGLVILIAIVTLVWTMSHGHFELALYSAAALLAVAFYSHQSATPWVMGKTLAISSPAVLAVALIGVGILWQKVSFKGFRPAMILMLLLAFGVLWSNERGYHDALLAPYHRLADLEHIGVIDESKGPVFINDYEIYADRHFLRDEAPVEPAEYRSVDLPLTDGRLLVKSAYADIDSFSLATLFPYRSIVTRNDPVESRPPSYWKLAWSGKYYDLWVRPKDPTTDVIEHVPLGDQGTYPYCGAAENGPNLPLCSIAPAAVPTCSSVQALATQATKDGANLVAYERPDPIVQRADYAPRTPATYTAYLSVPSAGDYELSIAGLFTRGFDVSVDGHSLGLVANQISDINGYVPVATIKLTPGSHTFKFHYPSAGWGPGSGDNTFTQLMDIALQPTTPKPQMLTVPPSQATTLCGKSLDWIELVKNNP